MPGGWRNLMKKLSVVLLVLLFGVMSAGMAAAQGVGLMGTVQMNAQNGSGQDGTVQILANSDGSVTVNVDIAVGATDVPQPAHIHDGTCANLNPKPKYPLSNVV